MGIAGALQPISAPDADSGQNLGSTRQWPCLAAAGAFRHPICDGSARKAKLGFSVSRSIRSRSLSFPEAAEAGEGACSRQQAMTSSVVDGGARSESPAPPAFSPLTDPADPGNREPSVNVALDHDANDANDADGAHGSSKPINNGDISSALAADTEQQPQQQQQQQHPAPATMGNGDDAMDIDAAMDPTMDYAANSGLDLYQNPTHLLMALARLSAASQPQQQQPQHMVLPPSTVRPSQVSLPPHALLDNPQTPLQANDTGHGAPPTDAPLESFARIEFADSVFQMTTYAVVIGRDQRALEQARKDERRLDEYQRRVRENEERGLPAPSPPTQDRGKFSKSYVSEEGGMLGPESDGEDQPRPAKRRKMSGGAGSASGDSHQQEVMNGEQVLQEDKNLTFNRQYVSHTPGAAAVNLSALRPSPYYVPFIGIHSPGPNIASRTKAISREHLRIQFNPKQGVFEAIPLHKNGFFCEDVHYKDEPVVLRSGDRLQIKDVDFVFIINGVPRGKTGAEECMDEDGASSRRYSEGGKEMSFDFENSHDAERRSTSPEEVAVQAAKDDSDSELSEPAEDIPEPDEVAEQQVIETIEKDPEEQPSIKPEIPPELLADLPPIPKKRGPGRPPKNGIMSKREERLRKKAALELAKKNMPQPPPGDPPVKRKVGRPRKHPLPENAPDRPEKRKYKPRKSKTGEEGGEGSDPEKVVKERRREKPKTPPPELKKEDYTEEQLQKPNKNYGVLIDEVLSAAPDGLTLKQIYKRIQIKYPYYYFAAETKGWESSVRHNLIGNDAFKKNEETHLWSRVPGIDIDAGKKRKPASPDRSSTLHTFGQHYPTPTASAQVFQGEAGQHQNYRPGSVPQRTGYPPGQGQVNLGQHPQQHPGTQGAGAAAQQGPRQAYPTASQVPGAAHTAGYTDPAAARSLQTNAQAAAYSSPYTSRPPPTAAAQPGATPQGATRQGLPPHSGPSPINGIARADASSGHAGAPGSTGPRPAQPAATNGNELALKPAVAPELVRYVTNFKKTVTEQLAKRTSAAEAVAMSVINRGLGLATESTVPNEEELEKIVRGVFDSSRKNLGANQSLHPGLVQALVNFKDNMSKTLEPRMGKLSSERLILSAVDRVLGFADTSTMPDRFKEAETVLIPAIKRVVTEHQKTVAAVASAGTTPAPRPAPPAPAQPHAPTTTYAGTPVNPAVRTPHTAQATGHPAQAAPRPPVPTPVSAATKSMTTATPTQQAPATPAPTQAAAQIPAAAKPQISAHSVSATTQAPVQAPGRTAVPAPVQCANPPVQTATPATKPAISQVSQPPIRAPTSTTIASTTPQPPAQVPVTAVVPTSTTSQPPRSAPPAATTTPIPTAPPALGSNPVPTGSETRPQVPTLAAPQPSAQTSTPAQPSTLAPPRDRSQNASAPGAAPAPTSASTKNSPPIQASALAAGSAPTSAAAASQAQTAAPEPAKPQEPAQTTTQPATVANMATATASASAPPPPPPPATATTAR